MLERAADGDDLLAEALKPSRHSLRTNSSRACRASLVTNATPLPAARRAAIASAARGGRLVADPDAAVEVEQHVVVARRGGGERHGAPISCRAMPRSSRSFSPAASLLASRSPPAATTTTSRPGDAAEKTAEADARGHRRDGRLRAAPSRRRAKVPKPTKPKDDLDPRKTYSRR